MTTVEIFAPAKLNLALHVTGQRDDGFHLLDSLVAFADIGDRVRLSAADTTTLTVSGQMAAGVPTGPENLCVMAADAAGFPVAIELEKNLPSASGIGGGSSDAAAVLAGIEQITGTPLTLDPAELGADVPVCLRRRATRMGGIGDQLKEAALPELFAVLVNPCIEVATARVFQRLSIKSNAPMSDLPISATTKEFCAWLRAQRNDLEAPAMAIQPAVSDVLNALSQASGLLCRRMSGSGATCFGLFDDPYLARLAAKEISSNHKEWWVRDCALN